MTKAKKLRVISVILVVSALLIAASFAVYSYYFSHTEVKNTLDTAYVMCEVIEDFNTTTGVKSSIKIKNTGNIYEYLRMRLVSYWVIDDPEEADDGYIVGKPSEIPRLYDEATDAWTFNTNDWFFDEENETYYYKYSVAPQGVTEDLLINGSTIVLSSEEDYDFKGEKKNIKQVVVIIPEAVQASPASAVMDMWQFVEVSEGELKEKSTTP